MPVVAMIMAVSGLAATACDAWTLAPFCFATATAVQSLRLAEVDNELKRVRDLMSVKEERR